MRDEVGKLGRGAFPRRGRRRRRVDDDVLGRNRLPAVAGAHDVSVQPGDAAWLPARVPKPVSPLWQPHDVSDDGDDRDDAHRAVTDRCLRCDGPTGAGRLFCSTCAPAGAYHRQNVEVRPTTIRVRATIAGGGEPVEPGEPAELPGAKVTARVRDDSAGTRVRVVVERNVWRRDREQHEDRLTYIDNGSNYYREVWTLPGTLDVTWDSGAEMLDRHEHGGERVPWAAPDGYTGLAPLPRHDG